LLNSTNSLRTELIVHAQGCSGNLIDSATLTGTGTHRQRLPAFCLYSRPICRQPLIYW